MSQPPSTVPSLGIGELARLSGRSVYTLRWYDEQKLIPGVVRTDAGHRRFSPRHVEWLALLERLRATGMSVAQMRAYTALVAQGRTSLPRQRDMLAAHREHVAQSIAAWRAALDMIDGKLAFYEQWLATGERPASEAPVRRAAPRPAPPKKR